MPRLTIVLTVLVINSLCLVNSQVDGDLRSGSRSNAAGWTMVIPPQKPNRAAPPRKIRLSGIIGGQESDRFTVIDSRNHETVVLKTDATRFIVKQMRGGKKTGGSNLFGGMHVEVIGVPGANDEVKAEVITFTDFDYRVAQAVESRIRPIEERTSNVESKVSAVEGNNQRLSGQLEELAAVSNAARGGTKAAQATADAAVAGVNATNERITAIDDFVVAKSITIGFTAKSTEITEQAKAQLQQFGAELSQMKGYVVEVAGFGDKTGTKEENIVVSQERADAVARYLVTNGLVPVRRLLLPVGYGTRESAEASGGRVEIRILMNKGLTSPAPTMNPGSVSPD